MDVTSRSLKNLLATEALYETSFISNNSLKSHVGDN